MLARMPWVLLLGCLLGGPVQSAELKIAFGQYTPPYVFEDGTGIAVDIVRMAMKEGGYQIEPVYVPIERGYKMFAAHQVDGTTIIQESTGIAAAYSKPFMSYHNRAYSLKSRNLGITRMSDLAGKTVVAFQSASKFLGPEFAQVSAANPEYKEIAQQQAQTQMLLLGRIDVAVMDEAIFRYYRQVLIAKGKVDSGVEFIGYELFTPTYYQAAFKDPAVRDAFDRGIAAMRQDGRYQGIYRKYTEQYFPVKD